MAEKEQSTTVELVAIERGFMNGVMVEPGTKFLFSTVNSEGKPRKLPKWAAKPGDPRIGRAKRVLTAADFKPAAADAAARKKVEQGRDLVG